MIGAFYEDAIEMPWAAEVAVSAAYAEMPLANKYEHTIEEMIDLQATLSKNEERFCSKIRYRAIRLKIKGKEYLRIHKLISELSPYRFLGVNGFRNRES